MSRFTNAVWRLTGADCDGQFLDGRRHTNGDPLAAAAPMQYVDSGETRGVMTLQRVGF